MIAFLEKYELTKSLWNHHRKDCLLHKYRLTMASTTSATASPFIQTYAYNALGNLTGMKTNSSATTTYTYTETSYANPHAATLIGSIVYTYDNNGNTLGIGTATSTWDYRNLLSQVVSSATTTTYSYDHEGNRTKYNNGTATTLYPSKLYDKIGSATTTKHIYAGNALVASIEGKNTAQSKISKNSLQLLDMLLR